MILETKNAIIESVSLGYGDRGFLTASLTLDYGGSFQSFGNYVLYLPKSYSNHRLESVAGHFIQRCLEIAGVTDWEKIVGRSIRVQSTNSQVRAIGHIVKDDWFCPSADFEPEVHKGANQS